jgi:hypothetical protein
MRMGPIQASSQSELAASKVASFLATFRLFLYQMSLGSRGWGG